MHVSKIQNHSQKIISFNSANHKKKPEGASTSFSKGEIFALGTCAVAMPFLIHGISKLHTKPSTSPTNKGKICKDFMDFCKTLSEENFKAVPKNIKDGTFNVDLHSHSNNSDGWAKVSELLSEVANYADNVFNKTGKKFTFALTDHDQTDGVKEAMQIINSNPEKYKNVNFIPGVEFSFCFNSNGKIKTGEMLAYFIDPDSKEIDILCKTLRKNRNSMIDNCIKKLGNGFARSDMENYFINKDGETFAYNLHYRLKNYAQIKNRINKMAVEQNTNPDVLYKNIMDGYVFENNKRSVAKPFVSPEGLDKHLKQRGISTNTPVYDDNINNIVEEFFPKIKNGKIISDTENSFEKIIDTFKDNDNVVFAFAHPYFTASQMTDYQKEFDQLIKYANGKITMSENYHQAYPSNIKREQIEEINNYMLSKNLIPIGGRDNHKPHFLG